MAETFHDVRVCAAIRRAGDEVLVVREIERGEELLSLPGGRPKFGESLESALVREVVEETGYSIVPTDIAYVAEQRGDRWENICLEICFYADVTASTAWEPDITSETVRGFLWLGPDDPRLRAAVPAFGLFLESRKGRYLHQERSHR